MRSEEQSKVEPEPVSNAHQESRALGAAQWSSRVEEVKDIVSRMDETLAWDAVKAKDLDPKLIEYVADELHKGTSPGDIAMRLGFKGGKSSKEWRKIQAHFRQGFRTDAELYIMQQTHKFYKVIDKVKDILEDAIENGTPHVVTFQATDQSPGRTEVIRVKGATKELGSFLKNYTDAISKPVQLWKDLGAIGEKNEMPQSITILVKNNIPMPTPEDILKHQAEIKARVNAIEVKGEPVEESK